jgi:UDP-N-acetylmuramoyl-tripeptide--D-alanyl-D-alanine ligase
VERLLAIGPLSVHAVEAFGDGASHFPAVEALVSEARAEAKASSTVLVKGSRAMRMERVVDRLAAGDAHAA